MVAVEVVYVEVVVVVVEVEAAEVAVAAAGVQRVVVVGVQRVVVVEVQRVVSILYPCNVLFPEPFSIQVVPSLLDRVVPRNTVTPWTCQSVYS